MARFRRHCEHAAIETRTLDGHSSSLASWLHPISAQPFTRADQVVLLPRRSGVVD